MPENLVEQLRDLAQANATHIKVLNHSSEEVCKDVKTLKEDFVAHKTEFAIASTNLAWLMKAYWVVAPAVIGGLVVGIFNLLFK